MPNKVVIEDNELLKMIIAGYTSAYTIYTFMKKKNDDINNQVYPPQYAPHTQDYIQELVRQPSDEKEKQKQKRLRLQHITHANTLKYNILPLIAYKNINTRVLGLARAGLIEEVKIGNNSIHGRKDYRVTLKGLEQLILPSAIKIQKGYVKTIVDHVNNKSYSATADRNILGRLLTDRFIDAANLLNEYLTYIQHPELMPIKEGQINNLVNKLKELKMYPHKAVNVSILESVLISDSVTAATTAAANKKATPGHTQAKDGLIPVPETGTTGSKRHQHASR